MHESLRSILVTEVLPPPDVGPQEAQRRAARHHERVTAQVTQQCGEVLLRVGQGCVAALPDAARALRAARALLARPGQVEGSPARLRAALHLGEIRGDRPAIAQPGVAEARKLLEAAAPNEVLLSAAARQALAEEHLQLTPVAAPRDAPDAPVGYRLLITPLAGDATSKRPPLAGWLMAGAVLLASAAILTALTATLLL